MFRKSYGYDLNSTRAYIFIYYIYIILRYPCRALLSAIKVIGYKIENKYSSTRNIVDFVSIYQG